MVFTGFSENQPRNFLKPFLREFFIRKFFEGPNIINSFYSFIEIINAIQFKSCKLTSKINIWDYIFYIPQTNILYDTGIMEIKIQTRRRRFKHVIDVVPEVV